MQSKKDYEKNLIVGLRDGSKDAFMALYDMYGNRLSGYCLLHVGCSEDAEDIVQDVFLNLWKTRTELMDVETIKPFLFASARNRIINHWKERTNSALYADYVGIMSDKSTAPGIESMEYREFERKVLSEIDKLSPTQKKVVMLSRFENLDVREISEKLGLSVQTVKNALSQGLKALRKVLLIICFLLYS